jgi:aspartyl-tRNA(Asn)/glutamyl-tRNA(Gln) amidotransferase subunit A
MALAPSMDKIGPMARSAEDCARIFAVLAGHDPKDHGTLPVDRAAFT